MVKINTQVGVVVILIWVLLDRLQIVGRSRAFQREPAQRVTRSASWECASVEFYDAWPQNSASTFLGNPVTRCAWCGKNAPT